jgi:hypothetical protein
MTDILKVDDSYINESRMKDLFNALSKFEKECDSIHGLFRMCDNDESGSLIRLYSDKNKYVISFHKKLNYLIKNLLYYGFSVSAYFFFFT